MTVSRRRFLQSVAGGAAAAWAAGPQAWAFKPVDVKNPLGSYPQRDWERIYLDQYRYDGKFPWICHPNDTHMCRMMAYTRNGVMIRAEQNYDHQRAGDLWRPRGNPLHVGVRRENPTARARRD